MKFLNFTSYCLFGLFLIAISSSCKQKKTILKSPGGYHFEDMTINKLEPEIKEISGLEWDPIKNVFLTHIDEAGNLYYLDRDSKKIMKKFQFGGKGDYEDIALVNNTPYLLRSDGLILRLVADSLGTSITAEELGQLNPKGKVDFETMYYDSLRHALVMICKNCDIDKDNNTVSAFAYFLDSTGFDSNPIYTIDQKKVEELSPKKTSKLQPSAARIQPNLKKLFIISSAANLLVVADLNGKVESVHWLKPKVFPQPEGLTFNRTGDMYISNEGVTGPSTIYRFPAFDSARRQ